MDMTNVIWALFALFLVGVPFLLIAGYRLNLRTARLARALRQQYPERWRALPHHLRWADRRGALRRLAGDGGGLDAAVLSEMAEIERLRRRWLWRALAWTGAFVIAYGVILAILFARIAGD